MYILADILAEATKQVHKARESSVGSVKFDGGRKTVVEVVRSVFWASKPRKPGLSDLVFKLLSTVWDFVRQAGGDRNAFTTGSVV